MSPAPTNASMFQRPSASCVNHLTGYRESSWHPITYEGTCIVLLMSLHGFLHITLASVLRSLSLNRPSVIPRDDSMFSCCIFILSFLCWQPPFAWLVCVTGEPENWAACEGIAKGNPYGLPSFPCIFCTRSGSHSCWQSVHVFEFQSWYLRICGELVLRAMSHLHRTRWPCNDMNKGIVLW